MKKHFARWGFAVCILVLAETLAVAAIPAWAFAQLSPEAQQAIQNGKDAAQQKDYLSAIRYFEQARVLAPNASEIYGYLGLTESKISGRELRAVAWYGAYLAANPRGGNAEAVNHAIAELMKTSDNNLSALVKTWEAAAENMPDSADRGPHTKGEDSVLGYEVARLRCLYQAIHGTNGDRRDFSFMDLGIWYAKYGSIEDARRIAKTIPNPNMEGLVLLQIIVTQLRAGDMEAVKRTSKLIRDVSVQEIAKDEFKHAEEVRKYDEVTAGAAASDWAQLFERGLNGVMFTDLAASMHDKSTEPWEMLLQLSYVANNLGAMQRTIKRMLKVQAAQRGTK
jgi:tetratricopeptide (TPR) repeat protein